MRTLDEAVDQFVYHPATAETAVQHARTREAYVDFLVGLWERIPDGPEKTLAIRKLQESAMYANLAIALTAPADIGPTASVARVLVGDRDVTSISAPVVCPLPIGQVGCDCS